MRIQEFSSFKDVAAALNVKSGHLQRVLFDNKKKMYKKKETTKKMEHRELYIRQIKIY